MAQYIFRNTSTGQLHLVEGTPPFDASASLQNGTYQVGALSAWAGQTVSIAAKPVHVFLLAGQSNATSRAEFDGGADWPADTRQWGRVGADDGQAVTATRPLQHHTTPVAGGAGWALQFAISYLAANPGVSLLFVPAAHGGTSFGGEHWNPGNPNYEDAVARTNAAMTAHPGAVFQGILWHQGESDTTDAGRAAAYQDRLDTMITQMRQDITAADATTPVVLGQLATSFVGTDPTRQSVQDIITDTVNRLAYTAVAGSAGLTTQADNTHFDAPAFRILGARYVSAFTAALGNAPTVPDKITTLSAQAGNGEVALSWDAPADGNAPLTDYIIARDGTVIADGVGTNTTFTDTGLTNETTYSYVLTAANAVGAGPASDPVSATPQATTEAEAQASGHWLLGADNSTSQDLVSQRALTGTAPTYAAGHIRMADGHLTGLTTSLQETADMTMALVIRQTGTGQNLLLGGNLTLPDDGTDGASPYISGSTGDLRLNHRGGVGNLLWDETPPLNQFYFLAFSLSAAGSYTLFRGGQSSNRVLTGSGTRNYNAPGRALSVGNVHFNNSSFLSSFDIAEVIVWPQALSQTQLQQVFLRSRDRLSARGISLLAPPA